MPILILKYIFATFFSLHIQTIYVLFRISLDEDAKEQMRKMLCQKESNHLRVKRSKMSKKMFKKLKTIGIGAFGEVTLVRKVDSMQLCAMKTLRKSEVIFFLIVDFKEILNSSEHIFYD